LLIELAGITLADAGDLQRLLVADLVSREVPLKLLRSERLRELNVRPSELQTG
jgi:hypothetical protein